MPCSAECRPASYSTMPVTRAGRQGNRGSARSGLTVLVVCGLHSPHLALVRRVQRGGLGHQVAGTVRSHQGRLTSCPQPTKQLVAHRVELLHLPLHDEALADTAQPRVIMSARPS
jgi:hypothetical protein